MPTAMTTLKGLLTPQPNMVAAVAGLTRVGRWNRDHFHARLQSLIRQKLPQLVERPAITAAAFRLAARLLVCPFPNTRQVLNRNDGRLRFGAADNLAADSMVHPLLKASFLPRQPLQQLTASPSRTACALRGFTLNRRSDFGVMVAHLRNWLTVPFVPLTGYSDISAPKIHADDVISANRIGCIIFQLDVDVVSPIAMLAQLGAGWHSTFELASLVVTHIEFDVFASIEQRQAHRPILFAERKDAGIVVCRCRLERLNGHIFRFCRLTVRTNTGANSNGLIGTQSELRTQILVYQILNRGLAGNSSLDSLIGVVASIRKCLKQSVNFSNLFRGGLKLANQCQDLFHVYKNLTSEYIQLYARIRGDPECLTAAKAARVVFPPSAEATGLPNLPS